MSFGDSHQSNLFALASGEPGSFIETLSITAAIFSEIDIQRTLNHEGHKVARRKLYEGGCVLGYIIAVGGAGSFGSPAADTGAKIMSAAKPASTIIPPTRYDGLLKICGG